MVFQSSWVFCLWSQFCSSFSFQRSVLCCRIAFVISVLIVGSSGSCGLFLLLVSLILIWFLIFSGRMVCLFLIWPLGM